MNIEILKIETRNHLEKYYRMFSFDANAEEQETDA